MAVKMIFEISGDSTPLARAIIRAMEGGKSAAAKGGRESGSEFGKQFGKQIKSAVMSFIGAGAIIGAIRKQIGDATKLTADAAKEGLGVEAMQELQKAAELTGMSVKELREAAPEVAEAFTKLMESVRSSGGILDAATVQQLADAGQDFKELQGNLVPGIAFLARALNGAMTFLQRLGQFYVGAATGVAGVVTGNADWEQVGDELMGEAWNGTGFGGNARNEQRQAAESFRDQLASTRRAETERRQGISSSFQTLRTAGPQRDLSLFGMVPGASREMVDALNRAVSRLESIDRNLE